MKALNKLVRYALSDSDIEKVMQRSLGDPVAIVEYQRLSNYGHIDELWAEYKHKFCVMFFPENDAGNVGHWTCIIKHRNNTYEYFDSYRNYRNLHSDTGLQHVNDYEYHPDDEKAWLSPMLINKLQIEKPMLTDLFLRSGINTVICNPYPFQKESPDINDCGRQVCLRLINHSMALPQYWNYVIQNRGKLTTDQFITKMIFRILEK
jgi:hypothetical protein